MNLHAENENVLEYLIINMTIRKLNLI